MTAHPIPPASELDDDEVLADAVAEHTDPEPEAAWVSTVDPRRWGFIDADGVFIPVPKPPLVMAGLTPPCTVQLYGGERTIIVEPRA